MTHVKTLTRPGVLRAQADSADKIQMLITILTALATIISLFPKEPA